jgi:hypothetical protein
MHKALGKGRGKELIYVTKEVIRNYKQTNTSRILSLPWLTCFM